MQIETKRFGKFDVSEDQIIYFEEGILGFPNSHRYILVPHQPESPFVWLQSVDESYLSFLMINPSVVKPDYVVQLPKSAVESLKLQTASEGVVFAIVVVPEDPMKMRMNLRAPVIINTQKRLGRQVVLEDTSLQIRYPIFGPKDQAPD